MIVEIEGIDGVGKTTQCLLLKDRFEKMGEKAMIVKDLDGTELGRTIKRYLVGGAIRSKEAEMFAFLSCKAQLLKEVIERAVADGVHVICDRGCASFLSYFEACGIDGKRLLDLLRLAVPDWYRPRVVIIDLEVEGAILRNSTKDERSRFDDMGTCFFRKQRDAMLRLANQFGWVIIDGGDPVGSVFRSLVAAVDALATDQ